MSEKPGDIDEKSEDKNFIFLVTFAVLSLPVLTSRLR